MIRTHHRRDIQQDPNIRAENAENFDRIVTEVPIQDYGDQIIGYVMSLPVDNDALDTDDPNAICMMCQELSQMEDNLTLSLIGGKRAEWSETS